VEGFRSQHNSISEPLLATLLEAWTAYATSKLSKGLGIPGDSPELAFDNWPTLYEFVRLSPERKAEGLKRDEKFEMHLNNLVSTHQFIGCLKLTQL
jgi:hypothetical protein